MPYCKKIKQLLLTCLLALLATNVMATNSGLTIKNAELIAIENDYILNADIDIKFTPEIEQAISKGFELSFLVEFQLVSPRKYWFDDEIVTVTHQAALSYHALSRQYLVTHGDQQKSFEHLEEAKQALSEMRELKVFQKSNIEKNELYNATLLMRLDYAKLPKALQVDPLGSDDWKMTSQRFEWTPSLFK